MTYDEMIEVIKALKEGRKCQSKPRWAPERPWRDMLGGENILLDFTEYLFRIKPEPREWWIWVDCQGKFRGATSTEDRSPNAIRVREVLEDE